MLRVEAYEQFKKRLLSGELKPGQFVTQRELAKLVGVPLNPAREAIQRLEFEALLKIHPQRGVQVVEASPKVINDAYDFRLVMEARATANFASTAPESHIERLIGATEAVLRKAERTMGGEVANEAVEIDWRMHDEMIDALDNRIISEAFRINAARIRLCRTDNRMRPERTVEALAEHLEVLRACLARDRDKAVHLIENHIETSRSIALGQKARPRGTGHSADADGAG